MIHINSGMSGIARYNTWVSAIFIFAVCLFMEEILKKRRLIQTAYTLAAAGICFTGLVVFRYGLYCASDTNYTYMTPVAEFILDKFPDLYNPLHSTFNSRTNHVDGGYYYETPIVYFAEDGYVRKILASEKDKDELLKILNHKQDIMTGWQMRFIVLHKRIVIFLFPRNIRFMKSFQKQIIFQNKKILRVIISGINCQVWKSGEPGVTVIILKLL